MKIKDLYERTSKIKAKTTPPESLVKPIKVLEPINPVYASVTGIPNPPKPPTSTTKSSQPTKKPNLLADDFPANVPTGNPEFDQVLHNLRNGVVPPKEEPKQRGKSYKIPTS